MVLTRIRPVPTGKLAANLFAVKTGTVNFFIYQDGKEFTCFDSGHGQRAIRRELRRLEFDPNSITRLFLTHSDFDHMGGLAVFEKAEIYLSFDEAPMIQGAKARMAGCIHNSGIKRPYHLLHDNDEVTFGANTIRAITTPGHTAGSVSYLLNGAILFVGDAFKLVDGTVRSLRPYINMDTHLQELSIRKLANLENIQVAMTGHWGYTTEFNRAICKWR